MDFKIDEDEFHKVKLFECDFFIRKVPDEDDDVFDFREVSVRTVASKSVPPSLSLRINCWLSLVFPFLNRCVCVCACVYYYSSTTIYCV